MPSIAERSSAIRRSRQLAQEQERRASWSRRLRDQLAADAAARAQRLPSYLAETRADTGAREAARRAEREIAEDFSRGDWDEMNAAEAALRGAVVDATHALQAPVARAAAEALREWPEALAQRAAAAAEQARLIAAAAANAAVAAGSSAANAAAAAGSSAATAATAAAGRAKHWRDQAVLNLEERAHRAEEAPSHGIVGESLRPAAPAL